MLRLIGQKLLLALLLLPLLNFVAFGYALQHPRLNPYTGQSGRLSDLEDPPRYLDYVQNLFQNELGRINSVPISSLVLESTLNSLALVGLALLLIVVLGPLLGYLSISRQQRRITPLGLVITNLGASMPGFFLGVAVISLMIYNTLLTGSRMPLPMSGFGLDQHLILPTLVLAIRPVLQVARVTANLIEHELQQDYFRVARSKGLSWLALQSSHILPNIGAGVINTLGQSARLLVPGLVIVETLFLWPGLGRLLMLSVGLRTDGRPQGQYFANPELLATIALVFGIWLLLADLVTSLLAYRVDPRLRESIQAG